MKVQMLINFLSPLSHVLAYHNKQTLEAIEKLIWISAFYTYPHCIHFLLTHMLHVWQILSLSINIIVNIYCQHLKNRGRSPYLISNLVSSISSWFLFHFIIFFDEISFSYVFYLFGSFSINFLSHSFIDFLN